MLCRYGEEIGLPPHACGTCVYDPDEIKARRNQRIVELEAALVEEKRLSDAISRDCNNTALERNKAMAERDAFRALLVEVSLGHRTEADWDETVRRIDAALAAKGE